MESITFLVSQAGLYLVKASNLSIVLILVMPKSKSNVIDVTHTTGMLYAIFYSILNLDEIE